MTAPLVSVIIVNWNRSEMLRLCLLALRGQTFASREVIVVDNGSTDASLAMVRSEFTEVALITNDTNRGYCTANNQGIHQARGHWVALLNNDAEPQPEWLEALVSAARSDSTVGMCASKILLHDSPHVIDKAGHVIYPDGQNRGRGTGEVDRGQYDRLEEVLMPDGCAALYDRRALDAAGLFDEDFFAYGDDAELGLRIRLAGWRCLYVPGAVVYHHHSSTLGRFSEEKLVLVERNRMWLAAKLFPARLLLLNPFYTIARLAANAVAALSGRGEAGAFTGHAGWRVMLRALVRAWLQGVKGLPRMFAKRPRVRRTLSSREFVGLLRRHRITARQLAFQSAPARAEARHA